MKTVTFTEFREHASELFSEVEKGSTLWCFGTENRLRKSRRLRSSEVKIRRGSGRDCG